MSNQFKSSLLAASAIIAAAAAPAHAQLVYPTAELHGVGASSISEIMPREANCIGNFNAVSATPGPQVNNAAFLPSGSTTFDFLTAVEVAGGTPKFLCATDNIQPNITLRYVSIGSGGGRTALIAATPTAVGTAIFGSNTRPDLGIYRSDTTTWSMPHFSMSDSPLTAGNIATWTANRAPTASVANAGRGAGAMIQIPLYVLPVAIAYAPTYGFTGAAFDVPMNFNVAVPTATGGLKLSKVAYCGIFNGNITNWNHVEIARANRVTTGATTGAGTALFDTVNDTASRWSAEGAPIRLVGRLDSSGTTDIFVRHLATACTGPIIAGIGTNKYAQAAESLPYNVTSGVSLQSFLSTTRYRTDTSAGTTASNFAGPTNMILGAVFDGSGFTGVAEGIVANATTGTNGRGLYLLANTGNNVAAAIANTIGGGALIPSANGSIRFNGKVGYLSSDTLLSQPTLRSAALEVGYTYDKGVGKKPLFAQPTAANATAAFGKTILPPESTSKGIYAPIASPLPGDLLRTNPLAWYETLYANLSTLANPLVGYPITGTTQMITGTCFADAAARNGMVTLLRTALGINVTKSDSKKFDKNLFLGTKAPNQSLRAQNGLAQLPAPWIVAIRDTFLARGPVKQVGLAALNLYIQNGMPTEKFNAYLGSTAPKIAKGSVMTATQLAGIPASYSTVAAPTVSIFPLGAPNPTCTPGQGITN